MSNEELRALRRSGVKSRTRTFKQITRDVKVDLTQRPKEQAILPIQKSKIAKRNKARASAMERRIANLLKGQRVPMSGSGSYKGDCIVPFDEYRSIYVECKLTEKNKISIKVDWLAKVKKDAKSMRCITGILVFHFMGLGKDFVLIPIEAQQYLPQIFYVSVWPFVYSGKSIEMTRESGLEPKIIQTSEGEWLLCDLLLLKSALESLAE